MGKNLIPFTVVFFSLKAKICLQGCNMCRLISKHKIHPTGIHESVRLLHVCKHLLWKPACVNLIWDTEISKLHFVTITVVFFRESCKLVFHSSVCHILFMHG